MTKPQLQEFRKRLLEERNKFAGELKTIARKSSKNPRDSSGDLSAYTVHMADMSADTYEREMDVNIASSEQKVLYQIDEALKRLEEDAYGTCQQCNKPVSLSRLKAVPYTELCIQCQRTKEHKK